MSFKLCARIVVLLLAILAWWQDPVAIAGPPAEQLLPAETKAFLSVPDIEDLRQRWSRTQLGKLTSDPVMQPFEQELRRQLRNRLVDSRFHFEVEWDEIAAACGGELCLAAIQPSSDPEQHAAVLILDTTGCADAAEALVNKITRQLEDQGAKTETIGGGATEITTHELPREKGQIEPHRVIRFLFADRLVVSNHQQVALDVLRTMSGDETSSLSDVPAFQVAMNRIHKDAGELSPQLRWFVEPFGYAQLLRQARSSERKRGKDMLNILRTQGFDAIQGIAGYVHIATADHEVLHRTIIYAPPVEGEPDRYRLAARMLQFPNQEQWQPLEWIPRELATYGSFRWKVLEAFDHADSLVDAVAGDTGFFADTLQSIKDDPNGPQIDVRNQLVRHLGDHITVISDYALPITPKSERVLFAVKLNDTAAVEQTIHQALDADRDAQVHQIEGRTVWEILNQEDIPDPDLELSIDDPLGSIVEEEEEEHPRPLANSAITVAYGHLLVATNIDFLREILKSRSADDQLGLCEDFLAVERHLESIGAGQDCARFFSRTDEEYRTTYELIRQGRMPQSESLLGRLLNRMLSPSEKDVPREQQIDGQNLPEYQIVRRYLGPAGVYVRAEEDGWYISGLLLDKTSAHREPADQPAITRAQRYDDSDTRSN